MIIRRYIKQLLTRLHFLPTPVFLRAAYWLMTGRRLNLDKPETFCDWLNWLKLHGRLERCQPLADKLDARDIVRRTIDGVHRVPLLDVYYSVDELYVRWDALPDRFVLKCTHGSHCGFVVPDKSAVDRDAICIQMAKWMRRSWFWYGREPQYVGIAPRIIAEAHIGTGAHPPDDYKVMCFGGRAEVIQLHRKRGRETRIDFFDRHGQRLPITKPGYLSSQRYEIPHEDVGRLIPVAEALASAIDTPYVRVDLYLVGKRVYFGEATLCDSAGFAPLEPDWVEEWLGELVGRKVERRQAHGTYRRATGSDH